MGRNYDTGAAHRVPAPVPATCRTSRESRYALPNVRTDGHSLLPPTTARPGLPQLGPQDRYEDPGPGQNLRAAGLLQYRIHGESALEEGVDCDE